MRRVRAVPALLAGMSLMLTGCSDSGSSRAVAASQAAEAFSASLPEQPLAACELLAPQTRQELEDTVGPCAQAVGEADLPQAGQALGAEVYGLDAVVRLQHDTMFLALFDNGWRVTAAGCVPREQDRPYTCEIKGE